MGRPLSGFCRKRGVIGVFWGARAKGSLRRARVRPICTAEFGLIGHLPKTVAWWKSFRAALGGADCVNAADFVEMPKSTSKSAAEPNFYHTAECVLAALQVSANQKRESSCYIGEGRAKCTSYYFLHCKSLLKTHCCNNLILRAHITDLAMSSSADPMR